ncbi:TetR/AcrR family transcriptional regulator [Cryptosporangium phraense]|uniref:TetR family transcriptional regulator n=1 Tax=Cryptosporangium phraense TaxID=2593070 RepID=A0A545APA7_9ACTN|nr:TetR family transcriptional regulator C-terminal domain-containing protein [Cryptosporangium phraense]TQS43091.1 TetR family transcriptional regulator [Cryptosporangium phraense]
MSPRRYDPGRRHRLVEATLDVIAERGVAGTTHRQVAAAADVPLGSVTYHFTSLRDLLTSAFTHLADTGAAAFEAQLAAIEPGGDARARVVESILADLSDNQRRAVLTYELYAAAARDPSLREITQSWMDRSRRALERHFDPATAEALDALIEGLILHATLSTSPVDPGRIRDAIRRFLPDAVR